MKIKPGTVTGKLVKSPQGVDIEEYLGIPFAKSPVGDLRFANPEPLPQFTGGNVLGMYMYMYGACIGHATKVNVLTEFTCL